MNRDHIELGYIDIPKNYFKYNSTMKRDVCDNILDRLYLCIDKELDPTYNRLLFLREVLESSLETNVDNEFYEVAAVINDCIKLLNED
jgi:hypothetical protein